ncbi:MAG: hypothetical protein QM704_26585 [Anaeromyxobacteraceae bacterium]
MRPMNVVALLLAVTVADDVAADVKKTKEGEAPCATYSRLEMGRNSLDLSASALRTSLASIGGLEVVYDQGKKAWEIYAFEPANAGFVKWFGDTAHLGSAEVMTYLVRCAYDQGQWVSYGGLSWEGRFGLGGTRRKPLADADSRARITACLLAHANQRHARQPISLRGASLSVSPGEAFALDQPEGVFFGDLFASPQPLYTLSSNLPVGFDLDKSNWYPPNVALGRTIDFDGAGWVRQLGRCQDASTWFAANGQRVCPGNPYSSCSTAQTYPPLFVYGMRLVNLEETWSSANQPALPTQLIERGTKAALRNSHCKWPKAGVDRRSACVGTYDPMVLAASVCGGESGPPPTAPSQGTVQLGEKSAVEVVLRDIKASVPSGSKFTAMIRFRTDKDGRPPKPGNETTVFVRDGAGSPVEVPLRWSTLRRDEGFGWLEVYPVILQKEAAGGAGPNVLSIRLDGRGDEKKAPALDAVGFLPGPPACCADANAPAWCDDVLEGTPVGGVCYTKIGD